jgi:hypothetical protein
MSLSISTVPIAVNEPVKSYAPNSPERIELLNTYKHMYQQAPIDVPMYIGGEKIYTSSKRTLTPPHEHSKVIGHYNVGDTSHVQQAIDAALAAKDAWANLPWEQRASIFLRAADLLAGPFRAKINAATMLYLTDMTDNLATYVNTTTISLSVAAAQNPVTGGAATKNEFDIFINGQYMDKVLYTWTPSLTASQTIIFDTNTLGFTLQSGDIFVVKGRWA